MHSARPKSEPAPTQPQPHGSSAHTFQLRPTHGSVKATWQNDSLGRGRQPVTRFAVSHWVACSARCIRSSVGMSGAVGTADRKGWQQGRSGYCRSPMPLREGGSCKMAISKALRLLMAGAPRALTECLGNPENPGCPSGLRSRFLDPQSPVRAPGRGTPFRVASGGKAYRPAKWECSLRVHRRPRGVRVLSCGVIGTALIFLNFG